MTPSEQSVVEVQIESDEEFERFLVGIIWVLWTIVWYLAGKTRRRIGRHS